MDQEERRYFRIVDQIGLVSRQLSEAEFEASKAQSHVAEIPPLDDLAEIDQQLEILLGRLHVHSSDIAELGNLLNRKIQRAIESSDLSHGISRYDRYPQLNVDLSACGIAFPSIGAVPQGSFLSLEMVLPPNRQLLKPLARVVACTDDPAPLCGEGSAYSYVIRCEFVEMSENVQEFLIQYLVKRQAALIKVNKADQQEAVNRLTW